MKMLTESELDEIKREEFERGYKTGAAINDRLAPARGIINAIILSIPVWFVLILAYFFLK